MPAPIRDHLSPKDPMSAPLLCSTKEHYFTRLSVDVEPGKPGFDEARWITSEDVNVEHLLDVFTTTDPTSGGVWGACAGFMEHLYWHKPRLVMLGPKIEVLPDDHPSKLECFLHLSLLFRRVGNHMERKRLLTHALKLSRERGDDRQLVRILRELSDVHLVRRRFKKGIRQAKEAVEISERLGDTVEQARCLINLAWLLHPDNQLDAAEGVASRAIDLLEKDEQFLVCRSHHVLGVIYRCKGEIEKAINHLTVALRIASSFNWPNLLFWIQFWLAVLSSDKGRPEDAHAHIEHAKLHAVNGNDTYLLAHETWLQVVFLHRQHKLEEAKSGALRAVDAFERLGAVNDVRAIGELLRQIDHDARRDGRSGYLSWIGRRW